MTGLQNDIKLVIMLKGHGQYNVYNTAYSYTTAVNLVFITKELLELELF